MVRYKYSDLYIQYNIISIFIIIYQFVGNGGAGFKIGERGGC